MIATLSGDAQHSAGLADALPEPPRLPLGATSFQIIAERVEKAAVAVTTNLPFSEWTSVIKRPTVQGADRQHH